MVPIKHERNGITESEIISNGKPNPSIQQVVELFNTQWCSMAFRPQFGLFLLAHHTHAHTQSHCTYAKICLDFMFSTRRFNCFEIFKLSVVKITPHRTAVAHFNGIYDGHAATHHSFVEHRTLPERFQEIQTHATTKRNEKSIAKHKIARIYYEHSIIIKW